MQKTVTVSKTTKNKVKVEDLYKGMTLHQHILIASDTYIGASSGDEVEMFVFDTKSQKIIMKMIFYIAGFFKIFDEILVNARDHTVRDKNCKNIKIELDRKTGEISVWNDGHGIPVVIHNKYNIYVPEMIFGNLLTSQNYGVKGKTVGGKNGYGAKLTNIYSKKFIVHTVGASNMIIEDDGRIMPDESSKKVEYKQVFRNNMYDVEKPEINKDIDQKTKTFTKITYLPDYAKFGMEELTEDMYSLLMKRCYDIAACTPKNVSIYINGKEITCRDFKDYIKLYYDDSEETPKITYERVNSRWEIGVGFSTKIGDRYVSFVNGISTFQGGTHVQHVVSNIVSKVSSYIKKKKEYKDLKIAPATIKQYLTFFVNCIVEDPGFNSQTKEFMNSKIGDWCSCGKNCADVKCDISEGFIEKLCNNGLLTEVVKMSEFKEQRELGKTDGKKVSILRQITKLKDADWAGTRNSLKASLFLTEGDSAKSFAIAGISVIGSDRYGVFPLKGKPLNVRNATAKQIKDNAEFVNIKAILGLKQGMRFKDHKDLAKLRYGSIIILTDQDPDGSHIKGLIINMLEYFWPDLLQIEGFVRAYNTPIVKAWKKSDKKKGIIRNFYSVSEFEKFKREIENDKKSLWEHKYYKGLGTSTEKEAKESFYNFEDNLVTFKWDKDEDKSIDKDIIESETEKMKTLLSKKGETGEEDFEYIKHKSHMSVTKFFDEDKVELRKECLSNFDRNNMLEYKPRMTLSYTDFFDKDMIFFSNLDNDRSIPSITDGFKPSQRMIMFCCFKRGRKSKEVKVAQLSGYVSDNTDYHHGEASLQGAIIGLAQNFPGSNNISLLKPIGNFGYRRLGGKDHASPRYIFTEIDPVTNYIFRTEDDEILEYNYDDDRKVEPTSYAPIVPMILINGTKGIGTGFSTTIYPHNPRDIVANLKRLINGKSLIEMTPWFNGFKGKIEKEKENKYIVKGKYTVDGNTVNIQDIPIVNGWIEPYEDKMSEKISVNKDDDKKIEHIQNKLGNNNIDMTITFKGQELQKMYKNDTLEKFLHMTQHISESNLHLFNANGKMTKYNNVSEIMSDFYDYRLKMYEKRREFQLKKLQNDMDINKYKVKYIREYLAKTLLIAGKKVAEVIKQLEDKKYPRMAHDHRTPECDRTYRYLTDMSMMSITVDKIEELEKTAEETKMIYETYLNTPIKDIWMKELDEFSEAYDKWCEWWEDENAQQNARKEKEKENKRKK